MAGDLQMKHSTVSHHSEQEQAELHFSDSETLLKEHPSINEFIWCFLNGQSTIRQSPVFPFRIEKKYRLLSGSKSSSEMKKTLKSTQLIPKLV